MSYLTQPSSWIGERLAYQYTDEENGLALHRYWTNAARVRREASALKEVVAELTLENRLLKKSVTGDGEDVA